MKNPSMQESWQACHVRPNEPSAPKENTKMETLLDIEVEKGVEVLSCSKGF